MQIFDVFKMKDNFPIVVLPGF